MAGLLFHIFAWETGCWGLVKGDYDRLIEETALWRWKIVKIRNISGLWRPTTLYRVIAFKYGATLYSFDCIIVPFLLISEISEVLRDHAWGAWHIIHKQEVNRNSQKSTLSTLLKLENLLRWSHFTFFQYNILKFKVFVTLSVNVVLMMSLSGVVSKDSY